MQYDDEEEEEEEDSAAEHSAVEQLVFWALGIIAFIVAVVLVFLAFSAFHAAAMPPVTKDKLGSVKCSEHLDLTVTLRIFTRPQNNVCTPPGQLREETGTTRAAQLGL